MLFDLLTAGAPGGSSGQGGSPMILWGMFLLIFLIMYFLMIRPQSKKQKEQRTMLESLKKGDKILTAGGIIGTIAGIKEKENILIVKISDTVKIELARRSVAQLLK